MAGRWTIEPRVGRTADDERLSARGHSAIPWSRILGHAIMLAIVLSLAVVVLLLTAWVTMISGDSLHEAVTGFEWPSLDGILYDMFTDDQGAPLW